MHNFAIFKKQGVLIPSHTFKGAFKNGVSRMNAINIIYH